MLQRLREYSERLDLPPVLHAESPVRYIIELDGDGRLLNPRPTDTADPSNPRTRRGQRRLVPQVQRTSGIKALLLVDKADYALGYRGAGGKAGRVRQCHDAFLALLDRCAQRTGEPSVATVRRFLGSNPLAQLILGADFDPGALITFRVAGVFPIDLPVVQQFWAEENDPAVRAAPVMQCLVCGRERPVLDRLQAKIKGVPGGQTSGTAIISANSVAFESYGLKASLIAPTCADCGERFTKAANELIASEANSYALGGAVFIFWTKQPVEFNPFTYLRDPQPEQVRALLQTVNRGQSDAINAVEDDTAFYATALSGSGGRAVVRDWIDTTVAGAKENLSRWFRLQRIVDPMGEEPRPLGLYPLAAATVRDAGDLAPPVPRAMLRAALTGTPLPRALLFQAVKRNRAEQTVTRPRAALIKAVWLSHQENKEEEHMVRLDPDSPSLAYQCGRLFWVLEQAQRLAIPGVKATIADRFFGTASSAPASVFSRLVRGAIPHLGKLERDRPGAYYALQQRLEDIQARIPATGYPRTLALEDQGLFSLGYYHQRAFDRARAREAAERRKRGEGAAPEAELAVEDLNENA